MNETKRIPIAILGGTGYVAGELARLLQNHPRFILATIASTSQVGEPVVKAFPHLAGTNADGLAFTAPEDIARLFTANAEVGVFAATPHGATAALLDIVLSAAERTKTKLHAVDLSADFRFADVATYEQIYGQTHPTPQRIKEFTCAVPEHFQGKPTGHATQPGCYTTSVVLAAYPFLAADLIEHEIFVSAITGSSGGGRKLAENAHHPARRSNLYSYNALAHRHEHEMRIFLSSASGGRTPEVEFVPHAGPYVRGIHSTLRLRLRDALPANVLVDRINRFYSHSPFVHATLAPPMLTEVVGTNRCRIGVSVRGRTAIVTSAIDNLVKGAAGGGVQWMNRLFDLPDETGLQLPGIGWY
ncbi:MAG: N-acetyl-gamma-glutamyl-phosphate reductase [Deltaproteobacteria bacterium]|nr:N-acetyl-gamma-glutamyl-phosphate reductase [Deltaproteobacteria bacterium]